MPQVDALLSQMTVHLESALRDMAESPAVQVRLARIERQEIPAEPIVIRVAEPLQHMRPAAGTPAELYDSTGLPNLREFSNDGVGVLQQRLIDHPALYKLGRRAYRALSGGRVHYTGP
jgi:hypothetical protein